MKQYVHPKRDEITLAGVLGALSDPIRLRIVQELAAGGGELPCGHFCVSVQKSTMSHHMRILREAGLVHHRSEGTHSLTSLRRAELETAFPGLLPVILNAMCKDDVELIDCM